MYFQIKLLIYKQLNIKNFSIKFSKMQVDNKIYFLMDYFQMDFASTKYEFICNLIGI